MSPDLLLRACGAALLLYVGYKSINSIYRYYKYAIIIGKLKQEGIYNGMYLRAAIVILKMQDKPRNYQNIKQEILFIKKSLD